MLFYQNNRDDGKDNSAFEDKKIELELLEIKAQMEGLKKYALDNQLENNNLKKSVTEFCKTLLQKEFALSQIGGENKRLSDMDIPELLSFTAQKIMDQNKEKNQQIKDVIGSLEDKNQIIEDLKNQITQFLVNKDLNQKEILDIIFEKKNKEVENNLKKEENNLINKKTDYNKEILNQINQAKEKQENNNNIQEEKEELPVKIIEVKDEDIIDKKNLKNTIKIDNRNSKGEPKKEKETVISHLVDLKKIMDNLMEIHWDVIESIAIKGFSEKKDITLSLSDKYSDLEKNSLEQKVEAALNQMKMSGILTKEKVNTWRVFFVYSLSELGKRIIAESGKFEGQELVECERDALVRQHSSINHGYGIKDCATILSELGYTDITYTNEENSIDLPNGDRYVPDIIAKNPKTGEKEFFEYELVHHRQSDFDRKCTKMRKVTNNLKFIVPDVRRRGKIMTQVDTWRLERAQSGDKLKNVNIYVTTIRNLQKNAWDVEDNYMNE